MNTSRLTNHNRSRRNKMDKPSLSKKDSLTNLPTRVMFEKFVFKQMDLIKETGREIVIILIDINRFKVININIGYEAGDHILVETVTRLKQTVSDQGNLYRIGSNKIAIVFPNLHKNKMNHVVEEIRYQLAKPIIINEDEIYVSYRAGIASSFGEITPVQLIKNAEHALGKAKEKGGDTFYVTTPADVHDEKDQYHFKLEMELYKALEKKELYLQYQPKISLTTGKMIGTEALLRWNHPKYGNTPPSEFIPIAENSGLIIPIGEWVLEEAIEQNKKWQEKGMKMVMSVNLSIKQLEQPTFINFIRQLLTETSYNPALLELEITESIIATEETIKQLRRLKKLGIQLSIDDFGAGFNSLKYLKEFPINTVKIDRSFIQQMPVNPFDETIVKSIISMCH